MRGIRSRSVKSWANERVAVLFTIVGLIIQMFIYLFFTTKMIEFEIKDWNSVIIFLVAHHDNVN